jgi:hypothetical protein
MCVCEVIVYYETIKREINTRLIYECRCDERLKAKVERSTRVTYTVLCGGQEHLKIKSRLIDEKFASVMGECLLSIRHPQRLFLKKKIEVLGMTIS